MSASRLAPAFVLTVLAATGCQDCVVSRTTPPRTRKAGPLGDRSKTVPDPDPRRLTPLNPRDAKGRPIYAHGTACVVLLPSTPPVREAPDTEAVDCPPEMDDPAWDHCPGTLYRRQEGAGCLCVTSGNRPPQPWEVPCPKP